METVERSCSSFSKESKTDCKYLQKELEDCSKRSIQPSVELRQNFQKPYEEPTRGRRVQLRNVTVNRKSMLLTKTPVEVSRFPAKNSLKNSPSPARFGLLDLKELLEYETGNNRR